MGNKLNKEDLDIVLEDETYSILGGLSKHGETLGEYLEGTNLNWKDLTVEELNRYLEYSGIMLVKLDDTVGYDLYVRLREYASEFRLNNVDGEQDTFDKVSEYYDEVIAQDDNIQSTVSDLVTDLFKIIVDNDSKYYRDKIID